jgi:hypothetical protein
MKPTPKLAPPGAGLPKIQTYILRYLVVPIVSHKSTWEEDMQKFSLESTKIQKLLEAKVDMHEKVLVPPMAGLEDSSRYWSVTETLEHLLIVGEGIKKCIQDLTEGTIPKHETKIADVKPKGQVNFQEVKELFSTFTQNAPNQILAFKNRNSPLKYAHPWFGKLNAKQWCWLMGVHQGIHRKQIEAIVNRPT